MEVIGTGFGRTGTLSTKRALELLGLGPCHHMEEAIRHPSQFRDLAAHVRGDPVDWRRALAGYRSQVDFPGAVIWRELLDAFPDAKVLHTVRDPDRWYDSTLDTIYQARTMVAPWVRRAVPLVDRYFRVNDAMIWDRLFEGAFEDRARAIEIFEARTEEVVATVPADRLLVFDVRDGWEPRPRSPPARSDGRRVSAVAPADHAQHVADERSASAQVLGDAPRIARGTPAWFTPAETAMGLAETARSG